MHPGQSYVLHSSIAGMVTDPASVTIVIPEHTTVLIVAGPVRGDPMLDVRWQGKIVMVEADTLSACGRLASVAAA